MRLLAIVLVLVLLGCGYRSTNEVRPVMEKRIVGSFEATNHSSWWRSPWYRPGEDDVADYPKFVLIAIDGTGCLVPGSVWALYAGDMEYLRCDRWLQPRYGR